MSPSQACMKEPISKTRSGGPCWNCDGPVRPPRPPLVPNPPLPLFILVKSQGLGYTPCQAPHRLSNFSLHRRKKRLRICRLGGYSVRTPYIITVTVSDLSDWQRGRGERPNFIDDWLVSFTDECSWTVAFSHPFRLSSAVK